MRRFFWRHGWLPLAGLLAVVLFIRARAVGPFDPTGRARYHSWPGDIENRLWFVIVELLVLYAVLRPRSYHRSWPRALLALALLTPWTLLLMFAAMHSGPVIQAHGMWLLLVCAGLFVTGLISFVAGPPASDTTVEEPQV